MLQSVAFVLLLGLALGGLADKLRLPWLVGYLLAGILLGPYMLNVLDGSLLSVSAELRRLALVLILLRAGLALSLADLRSAGRPALLLCFVPALFELCAVLLLAPALFHISLLQAGILGSVLAAVSPAVIVPRMLRLMQEGYGAKKSIPQMLLAGASVDDVFVIVVFTALTGLAAGGTVSPAAFAGVPVAIACGAGVGFGTGLLLGRFFGRLHMRDTVKALLLFALAFLLMAAEDWLAGLLPFSGLLAVMAMGVGLLQGRPVVAKRLSGKLSKLWVGAEIVLFVLVGAAVDIRYAFSAGGAALLLLGGALLMRMAGAWLCTAGSPLNRKERLFCALAYTPKATVQAAIGAVPLGLGLPGGELILAVAVVAILVTAPLGALAIDTTYKKLLEK